MIVDNVGKTVFCPYYYDANTLISNEAYFKKITSSGDMSGSFKIRINNEYKFVTYTKSLVTDFYLINIRSFNEIIKPIQKKRAYIIVISILFILFFGFSSFYISRRIYHPIKKITDIFSNSKYGKFNPQMGEMDTISKVYNETLVHLKNLEAESEDKSIRLKEEFLRLILLTDSIPDSIKSQRKDYKFRIKFENLIHVSVNIDSYSQIGGNDRYIYITTLCKTIPELVRKDFYCEVVDMFEGKIALLLNYRDTINNNFDTLLKAMDAIRESSQKKLKLSLTIGIGGVSTNIDDCCTAYNKAVEMVKHRFVLGTGTTIYQRYVDENLIALPNYPNEIEDKLITSIRTNTKSAFIKNLDDLVELLKNYQYSDAVSVIFQIAASCIKTINQTATQDNKGVHLKFDEFSNIFTSFQTLNHAKDWLIGIFSEYQKMLEKVNQLKSNKHYKVIEKIQNHIQQNYQDMNLSVDVLSELTGYTPYYLTKIFKEITGINFLDYIRQIRIEKAKELLNFSDLKINEIPGMVGFTNLTHFYSVFKKDVGLTPAAFREYKLSQ